MVLKRTTIRCSLILGSILPCHIFMIGDGNEPDFDDLSFILDYTTMLNHP